MAEIHSGDDLTVLVLHDNETSVLQWLLEEKIKHYARESVPMKWGVYALAMDMGVWPDGFVTCSACDVVAEYSTDEWDDDNGVCPDCVAAGVR